MRDVYIVEGVRTAIGKIGGAFKEVQADFLGSTCDSRAITENKPIYRSR